MAVEEYGAMFLVVGISAVVGFIIGKITTKMRRIIKKLVRELLQVRLSSGRLIRSMQRFWNKKIPEKVAADELSKLEIIKASNEKEGPTYSRRFEKLLSRN